MHDLLKFYDPVHAFTRAWYFWMLMARGGAPAEQEVFRLPE